MTSDTSNNHPLTDGATGVVDAFLRVLTENTKASGVVESELKNIAKSVDKQSLTLEVINKEITAIRVEFSSVARDVKDLKEKHEDHEQRLRATGKELADVGLIRDRVRTLEIDISSHKASQATKNQEQDEKLHLFDKQQTRILAIGGVLMLVFQAILSLFIQPIVEKALF